MQPGSTGHSAAAACLAAPPDAMPPEKRRDATDRFHDVHEAAAARDFLGCFKMGAAARHLGDWPPWF